MPWFNGKVIHFFFQLKEALMPLILKLEKLSGDYLIALGCCIV